jgi:arabinogalactan oligomer / maltooligosaccharide transport system permease protein
MSNISRFETIRSSIKFQKQLSVGIRLVVALVLIAFAIFPVLWIISASFDSSQSLATQTLIPSRISLINYQRLFGLDPSYKFGDLFFQKWVFNSVKISGSPPF